LFVFYLEELSSNSVHIVWVLPRLGLNQFLFFRSFKVFGSFASFHFDPHQQNIDMNCAGLGNQSFDVVLVKGAFNLEEPQRVGISEWETDGEQMGSNREGWI
jgi:hypothetical protein